MGNLKCCPIFLRNGYLNAKRLQEFKIITNLQNRVFLAVIETFDFFHYGVFFKVVKFCTYYLWLKRVRRVFLHSLIDNLKTQIKHNRCERLPCYHGTDQIIVCRRAIVKKKRVVNCYCIIEPTERTLQSYELNYFIEQRVILLTSSDS